ncbi:MAG: M20 family metallopeptidase [Acidobacteriota bacterium]
MAEHSELLNEAKELLPDTVALRRAIHSEPELGLSTPKTKEKVLAALEGLPLELRHSETTSGVVACLRGAKGGKSIVLRGDMDALPMPEDTGFEFASKTAGRMHACGHDAHTAMLAGAARLLSKHRDSLAGEVRFMFQPGEEGPGGAEPMLAEGLLDEGGAYDAAFALHVYPNLASGTIGTRGGPLMAANDIISITITGSGGHASMPHQANDPMPAACQLVTALQAFVTRRIPAFDPVVLTITKITAGTTDNVIPEGVDLLGTLRSFSVESRETAHAGIRRLAESFAAAHEMKAEVTLTPGYPATINDPSFVGLVGDRVRGLLGDDGFHEMPAPIMGAEDFSLVLQRAPGAMAFLGVAPPGCDPEQAEPCHSTRMKLDEDAMAVGVAVHASVALGFLGE